VLIMRGYVRIMWNVLIMSGYVRHIY